MRFPKLSQLDKDQTAIYQGAPPEGTVLIIGPPGTGKTVIAFHRAHVLAKLERKPRVMMFNKVLAKYTSSRDEVADGVSVSTLHQWTSGWWRSVARTKAFPPTIDGERFVHDWQAIQMKAVMAAMEPAMLGRVNWGHLIIDEGQDFPPEMYGAMKTVMEIANSRGASPPLGITVLADENQRLWNRNSTLEQIRSGLGLHEDDRNLFCLKKNYRNTREIALFASSFYVGAKTGIPDLPEREGSDLPVLSLVSTDTHDKFLTACAEKISRYATSRRTEEVGVLVTTNKDRKKIFNRLEARLKGTGVALQSYARDDEDCPAENLEFDVPGHVTVLNFASAKGLEFDAVFILDPANLLTAGSSELSTKMNLYVMSSRARSVLNVFLVNDDKSKEILGWIPPDRYRLEEL